MGVGVWVDRCECMSVCAYESGVCAYVRMGECMGVCVRDPSQESSEEGRCV